MEFPVIQRIGTAIRTQRVAREYGIDALTRVLQEYLPEDQIAEVRRAYEFGARMHQGQNRESACQGPRPIRMAPGDLVIGGGKQAQRNCCHLIP